MNNNEVYKTIKIKFIKEYNSFDTFYLQEKKTVLKSTLKLGQISYST